VPAVIGRPRCGPTRLVCLQSHWASLNDWPLGSWEQFRGILPLICCANTGHASECEDQTPPVSRAQLWMLAFQVVDTIRAVAKLSEGEQSLASYKNIGVGAQWACTCAASDLRLSPEGTHVAGRKGQRELVD